MYIQEIVIEGFKSYAQRVTLSNFDPAFNAITGLNGSGKSNILDSVCFVLGIKNLSQVRAGNLQELVYKQGQAGIQKATVSVTWHNDDPKTGPAGYEEHKFITITRQVVIGGRNKYLINGHAAQENRVQDLFHSVQLNVNNPHFLIMQGRITKVLNMKPPEIMSLLEEAAGTRMYEKKKDQAIKTLDKKQKRLEEIDSVLNHDLLPSLETLRQQCAEYNEWLALTSHFDRLKRFLVAHDFCECTRKAQLCQEDITKYEDIIKGKDGSKQQIQADLEEKEALVKELQTEKEIQAGGEIKELSAEVDQLKMDLTKDTTNWKNRKEAWDSEASSLKQLQAQLKELVDQNLEQLVAKAIEAREAARAALEAAEKGVEAATRELAGAEVGDGRDESNRSLQERLADAQNAQTSAETEARSAEITSKHLQKQLAEHKKLLASKDKEATNLQRELAKHQAAVESKQKRLDELRFDPAAYAALEREREAACLAVRRAREKLDSVSSGVAGLDFRYSQPSANFDHSKVRGVLAKLFKVKDPETLTAVEVAAGGKLYQVVCDDEKTTKDLLSNGRLTKRVTMIPLNKIQHGQLAAAQVAAASKVSKGAAQPALDLVEYEGDLEPAIKYAFGYVLICKDGSTAKNLAYHRDVHTRCVSLEGDDYNPNGTVTGGARNKTALLSSIHAMMAAEEELAAAQQRVATADSQLRELAPAANEYRTLGKDVELAQHSLVLLRERVAGSEAAQLADAVETTEKQLAEAQQQLAAAQTKKKELVVLAKQLERDIAEFDQQRDSRIKAAQTKLKKAKAEVESCKKSLKQAERDVQQAEAERETAAAEKLTLEGQISAAQEAIVGLETESEDLRKRVGDAKSRYDAAHGRLEARRARMRECDAEISQHEKERNLLARQLQDVDVEVKRLENKIKQKQEEVKKFHDHVAAVQKNYSWIEAEKGNFGQGEYDFARQDVKKMIDEYDKVDTKIKELGSPNARCLTKLETAEKEYDALKVKRETVEKDRQRIEEVIQELDEKKECAMEKTWQKVNVDFGSIFSTLLPGTEAKLEPPEGGTFLEGLEVRVAFGGVWKESLTELSGGQRSLLALSLILALCKFKPAPLYILDEVDAALDLNHTQNIGRMIKHHFPMSQFLVVSLKEGMFNNANVLFRTKFVDGVSAVTRVSGGNGNREADTGKGAAAGAGRPRAALREATNRG